MELEQAKAKARGRLQWVADHPDYEGEGDKVVKTLLAEVDRLTAAQCDRCVMTLRGPSRLKFENPPVGVAFCELEDGSGVGRNEALIWREGFNAGMGRAAEITGGQCSATILAEAVRG